MIDPDPAARLLAAYRKVLADHVILRRPAPDVIVMGGSTRLDFLQRMSTNDFAELPPGSHRATVLTTPLARIVDVLQVCAQDDHLLLLTSQGLGQAVLQWLRRYVFFQDDVTLRLDPAPRAAWLVLGPSSAAWASNVWPGPGELSPQQWLDNGDQWIWSVERPAPGGLAILAVEGSSPALGEAAEPDDLAAELYEILRIESGLPTAGREVTGDRIPLEVGLADAISFTKGCYIGQEIIARMTARDRLARRLVGVRLVETAAPGTTLVQSGQPIGEITSVARSPLHGWIALALVRPAALATESGIVGVGTLRLQAQLVELPFSAPPV